MSQDRTAAGVPQPEVELIGRRTAQREQVLRALAGYGGFVSAQALHARLLAQGLRVGLSTVYRTLAALIEAGRVDLVREGSGERLFRYRAREEHQHYLLCRDCGTSQPVDAALVEAWAERISLTTGFSRVEHTVELVGTCADCGRSA
ncbi:Fur family transcriptional regulator [Streptomyces sp. NPDC092296]|uniref:Fur family transcriptional regulator n=1 Tax=Streptomyces sp. NPDC092296 TaxID=3366012 RepID=UPI003800E92C